MRRLADPMADILELNATAPGPVIVQRAAAPTGVAAEPGAAQTGTVPPTEPRRMRRR